MQANVVPADEQVNMETKRTSSVTNPSASRLGIWRTYWTDYAEDAVFFGLREVLRGPDAIRIVLKNLFAEFAQPGVFVALKEWVIESLGS